MNVAQRQQGAVIEACRLVSSPEKPRRRTSYKVGRKVGQRRFFLLSATFSFEHILIKHSISHSHHKPTTQSQTDKVSSKTWLPLRTLPAPPSRAAIMSSTSVTSTSLTAILPGALGTLPDMTLLILRDWSPIADWRSRHRTCCKCRQTNMPTLSPERCALDGHYKCPHCYVFR